MSTLLDLKVAMLIQAYHPHVGGAERQLMSLTPLLRERGADVRVFTRAMPPAPREDVVAGARVTRLPVPGPKVIASLAYTAGATAAMRAWRPDVIHAHELLSPTTTAMLARRLFRVPIVAKVLRGGALGDVTKLQRTATGRRRLAAAVRDVDAFVVISREIDRELEALGVPASRRHFVPNGVDTARFAPSPVVRRTVRTRMGVGLDVPVAVYCGRIASEKRVLELAREWTAMRPSAPPRALGADRDAGAGEAAGPEAELWVVGDGPLLDEVRRAAAPSVRIFGPVDRVEEVLAAADLFVLPSDTEGLSNAMLEAMASGLPVVATAVGAAVELLADGRSGVLVQVGDIDGVLEAISGLFGRPGDRHELGTAGRERVRASYDLAATADGLVTLYRALLRGTHPRATNDRAIRRAERVGP
ncbi:MAG: glycosyltransferase family 4 protein [Trueperaceae bacterium]